MSTELTIIQKLIRGIWHKTTGRIGETVRREDRETGDVRRYVRIETLGVASLLDLDTDEQVSKFEELAGSWCRALGPLHRRGKSEAVRATVKTLLLPGMKEWKDPTDDEIMAGGTFNGWGKVVEKRFSEFRGESYRSLQLAVFGEIFRYSNIEPDFFETLPETGILLVDGRLDARQTSSQYGREDDLFMILEKIKPEHVPGSARQPSPPPEPQEGKKTA